MSDLLFEWQYDDAGRLTDEVFTDIGGLSAGLDDYAAGYECDLVGNRLTKTVDLGADGSIDEVFASLYDANDRLLSETADTNADQVVDRTTAYGWGGAGNPATTQTGKSVTDESTGQVVEQAAISYDLQGRMSRVTVETLSGGTVTRREATTLEYDDNGLRVSALHEVDSDADGSYETRTRNEYLFDSRNHTGYAQVLEETVTNADTGAELKKIVYTIGLDVLAQTVFTPGGLAEGETHVLLYDAHGSTRFLADLAAAILEAYTFDAYGNALGFNPAAAQTSLLYSGEAFDARIGHQYLRARWYNPTLGRFNRLDPFSGTVEEPQSLHKYLYTHADPISSIDPSGENLIGLVGAIGLRMALGALQGAAIGAVVGGTLGCVDAVLGGDNCLEGAAHGAKWGAIIGGGIGALAPLATLFLPATVNAFLLELGAGASLTLSGVGAGESFANGNILQGIFRMGVGALGGYRMHRTATRSSRPVNIGGVGEVKGAVNLQGRWALGKNWFGQLPGQNSKSLARLIAEGKLFKIYNAWTERLPYRSNSVPKVYTNSVPVDQAGGLFPAIRSSEIIRILRAGGQWIRDGQVVFTKPG